MNNVAEGPVLIMFDAEPKNSSGQHPTLLRAESSQQFNI
jgi:hypothetical protein